MLPTRLHGLIDYGVAASLAGMSALRPLPAPVRAVLAAAGAYHASYAILTDYEAGLTPRLTMRQHLCLDALGGAALCGAGLLMRRQPPGPRALLAAIGLAELAVVASSSASPLSGPGQGSGPVARLLNRPLTSPETGYAPLDTPKQVADDIFIVDSLLPGLRGAMVPVRMTVLRLENGDLLLYSPTRFSIGLKHALAAIGRIRHLVAPSFSHWIFLGEWERHCPGATSWAAPGLRERPQVRLSGLRLDHDLTDTPPPDWGGGITLRTVPGGLGFHEVALFHQKTRTLLLADLVVRLEPQKLHALARPLLRLLGMVEPDNMPPAYARAIIKLRRQAAADAASHLLALCPDRVIFAHGRWFEDNATASLRRSWRWLLPDIPSDPAPDNTLALLREGYTFISRRCDRLHSDLFRTRLMLTQVVCMRGAEAARIFYEGDRFTRQGAMPRSTLMLLQDKGSVQSLDGDAHRHRKRMFMSLMTPEAIARITARLDHHWHQALRRWEGKPEIVLLPELDDVLTRTVCDWAGVPLPDQEAPELARELAAAIGHAGRVGPGTVRALTLRQRTERRMRRLVERIRAGEITPPDDSAAAIIARHADPDGTLLDTASAAVELINVLRPTIAVGRFITFAALALHEHPNWRQRLAENPADLEPFVQEVRRFYPFFPVIAGRVRLPFDWRGHAFAKDDWVVLDLYGTNHDPRMWDEPEQFRPERFRDWQGDPFTLIPQGGGDFLQDHRCPGEWLTIALMKQAVRLLQGSMDYEVPPQDLGVSLSHMPTAPRSLFVMRNVRQRI